MMTEPKRNRNISPRRPCACLRRFLLILIATLLLAGVTACNSVFFYPSRDLAPNPAVLIYAPDDVCFMADDGVILHGWFFPAANPRGSILVLHGNAENISTHVNSVLWLVPAGFNVFIFDYRGYGASEGKPTLDGVQRDAEAALAELLKLPGVDPQRIVVLGQSIGGAVAVNLVATSPLKKHVRLLVIDSAFSSHRAIAREKLAYSCITWPFQYPLSFLVSDHYSPRDRISLVAPVPVLILHGLDDPIVPVQHGQLLYAAAREPREIWFTARPGHVQSFSDEALRAQFVRYVSAILENKSAGQ